MFGYRPENGDLATAFEISLANHANCLQIYLAKILDTTQTAALKCLASPLAITALGGSVATLRSQSATECPCNPLGVERRPSSLTRLSRELFVELHQ
jgi:hypothetical protein